LKITNNDSHSISQGLFALAAQHNARVKDDLIDQLFNSSEKRLALTLLLARDWHTTNYD
jgi:hypothetical protein